MAVDALALAEIGLRVADLALWLDGRASGVPLMAPPSYLRFLDAGPPGDRLILQVVDSSPPPTDGWRSLYDDAETWQLWRDAEGRHVFVSPRHAPPARQVTVDTAFRSGHVVGAFSASLGRAQAVYPLDSIDIVLFANWLAETGGLIVHAAGIDDGGAGYAFVGPSGSGKSTLIGQAAPDPLVSALGEDQVILRQRGDRFVVYGTPWHTIPERCAPGGVPLQKLFFLERGAPYGAEPLPRRVAIERLMQDSFIPLYNRGGVDRILDSLACLAEQVPFYRLSYRIGSDVLGLVREA